MHCYIIYNKKRKYLRPGWKPNTPAELKVKKVADSEVGLVNISALELLRVKQCAGFRGATCLGALELCRDEWEVELRLALHYCLLLAPEFLCHPQLR